VIVEFLLKLMPLKKKPFIVKFLLSSLIFEFFFLINFLIINSSLFINLFFIDEILDIEKSFFLSLFLNPFFGSIILIGL